MLTITFKETEYYDETTNTFLNLPEKTVDFEFSLRAISRWEQKWKIPFLSTQMGVDDFRLIDFYLMMSLDPTLSPLYLDDVAMSALSFYMNDKRSATIFTSQNESNANTRGKIYTAEEFYALMFMNGIDLEFENRNLNELLNILRIISHYNSPPKKMSKEDIFKQNRELNAKRKAEYNTKG